MSDEPESLVIPRAMRAEIGDLRADMRTGLGETRADLEADIQSLRADVASDLMAAEAKAAAEHRETREQIVGLRRAVVEYHTTVLGHGVLTSELEACLRGVEQHLDLRSLEA